MRGDRAGLAKRCSRSCAVASTANRPMSIIARQTRRVLAGLRQSIGMASQSTPNWNQIASFLESMQRLRDSVGFAG